MAAPFAVVIKKNKIISVFDGLNISASRDRVIISKTYLSCKDASLKVMKITRIESQVIVNTLLLRENRDSIVL